MTKLVSNNKKAIFQDKTGIFSLAQNNTIFYIDLKKERSL